MPADTLEVVEISMFERSYRIHNPGPGRVGSKLARGEPYERKLLVDIAQQRLTGTAFDVGAHIGNHTLFLAAICGFKVHAWEPYDRSRAMLVDNLAINPGLDVTVHDWAAGAVAGRGRFVGGMQIDTSEPGQGTEALKVDRGGIPVHRIDDHLAVADLAVIKVDVEGMEPHVLTGALGHIERCRPLIYAETHTDDAHVAVAELLEPLGYEMTRAIHMGSTMERWAPR